MHGAQLRNEPSRGEIIGASSVHVAHRCNDAIKVSKMEVHVHVNRFEVSNGFFERTASVLSCFTAQYNSDSTKRRVNGYLIENTHLYEVK